MLKDNTGIKKWKRLLAQNRNCQASSHWKEVKPMKTRITKTHENSWGRRSKMGGSTMQKWTFGNQSETSVQGPHFSRDQHLLHCTSTLAVGIVLSVNTPQINVPNHVKNELPNRPSRKGSPVEHRVWFSDTLIQSVYAKNKLFSNAPPTQKKPSNETACSNMWYGSLPYYGPRHCQPQPEIVITGVKARVDSTMD